MAIRIKTRVEIAERMTAEEFWNYAPETKAELIDGVMIVHSPASNRHERLFGFLFRLIGDYVDDRRLGQVLGSRTAVEIAKDQVYEPDILFVRQENRGIIKNQGITGSPDFIIEILSPSTAANDRGPKFRGYERVGVREVWIIDPYGPAGSEFYRLQEGRYEPVMPAADGRLDAAAIPGFWIDVNWLWPELDFISVRQALEQIQGNKK